MLSPLQRMEFMGSILDFTSARAFLPLSSFQAIQDLWTFLKGHPWGSLWGLASGSCVSWFHVYMWLLWGCTSDFCRHGLDQYIILTFTIWTSFCASWQGGGVSELVIESRQDLQWSSLCCSSPDMAMVMDALIRPWGVYLGYLKGQALWTAH